MFEMTQQKAATFVAARDNHDKAPQGDGPSLRLPQCQARPGATLAALWKLNLKGAADSICRQLCTCSASGRPLAVWHFRLESSSRWQLRIACTLLSPGAQAVLIVTVTVRTPDDTH